MRVSYTEVEMGHLPTLSLPVFVACYISMHHLIVQRVEARKLTLVNIRVYMEEHSRRLLSCELEIVISHQMLLRKEC